MINGDIRGILSLINKILPGTYSYFVNEKNMKFARTIEKRNERIVKNLNTKPVIAELRFSYY